MRKGSTPLAALLSGHAHTGHFAQYSVDLGIIGFF
jgi:hypothetical protein